METEQERSTLRASRGGAGGGTDAEARVPGLMRLFGGGRAMAVALRLKEGALELGRGVAALGEVQDAKMSRRHAQVRFDGQRFWVTDLGSQNGTFVDGAAIPKGTAHEARRVVRMGDSLFVPSLDLRPLEAHGVEVVEQFVRGPAMQGLLREVAQASLGHSLYIHGESGTGKEGVARAFHSLSSRRSGPFIAVNCAAIPESLAERLLFGARKGAYSGADVDAQGYLQSADGGTLFLDEVVELDLAVQAKLLRVLENREVTALGASKAQRVDLHVCCASNKALRAQVANGRLREDLYFRIGRPDVTLPPLRQRPEEIPLLLERGLSPGRRLHVSLVEECLRRPWPGNIRELMSELGVAEHAAQRKGASRVEGGHLKPDAGVAFGQALSQPAEAPRAPPRKGPSKAKPLPADERTRIEHALRQHGGNVTATAGALGMHRTQLRRLLDRQEIAVPDADAQE
ncbi:sigma 54-interacting transcriptional regulator [Myxococcus faecalis]|uniref:sigma 54-interacting transcriptional regulator n=1 Tax=Myxococcus TaxID=32 RepID=UPI001CBF3011|nr:sigma 54-interacting transcriptional regulator [Myxococcus sp. AS-1-15]MBZ4401098.1 sigma 54-interacting transcriptional regulator [Myxococcus sp. AS-1-15]BDT32842.1 sigma 54-interacting transcriptional regulator [Myxococcus sp. MH1]